MTVQNIDNVFYFTEIIHWIDCGDFKSMGC